MTLKDRKRTNNVPRFNTGLDSVTYTANNLRFTDLGQQNVFDLSFLKNKTSLDTTNLNTKYENTSLGADINNAGNIGGNAVAFAGSVADAYGSVQNQSELIANAGTHATNAGGITYQNIDPINQKQEMDSLHTGANTLKAAGTGAALGASIGSIFPIGGTVIGGVVGAVAGGAIGAIGGIIRGKKLKDRIRIANASRDRINSANRNDALSQAAQQNYYSKYGDSTQGILYANRGKDLKQPIRL